MKFGDGISQPYYLPRFNRYTVLISDGHLSSRSEKTIDRGGIRRCEGNATGCDSRVPPKRAHTHRREEEFLAYFAVFVTTRPQTHARSPRFQSTSGGTRFPVCVLALENQTRPTATPRDRSGAFRSFQFRDLSPRDGCARLLVRSIAPPSVRSFLSRSPLSFSLSSHNTLSRHNIYIGNALPFHPRDTSSSADATTIIIRSAQPISVTMGRFPERSGVDAKLSEGSLFDLLLPIYKHERAGKSERPYARAFRATRNDDAAPGQRGAETERERERKRAREEMASIPLYLLRGVFIRPTVFPRIHYLHTYSGAHHANTTCSQQHQTVPLVPLAHFSSFYLCSPLGSAVANRSSS